MDRVESGDDIDPGIIKQVKVYIASKTASFRLATRWLGRHGQQGAWSRALCRKKTCRFFFAGWNAGGNRAQPAGCAEPYECRSSARKPILVWPQKRSAFRSRDGRSSDGIPESKIREYLKDAKKVRGLQLGA